MGWYQAEFLAVSIMGVSMEGKEIGQIFLHVATDIVCYKSLIDS